VEVSALLGKVSKTWDVFSSRMERTKEVMILKGNFPWLGEKGRGEEIEASKHRTSFSILDLGRSTRKNDDRKGN